MITKVTGIPTAIASDTLTLAVGAFEYEILIPEFARRNLQDKLGREVVLHTVEYLEGNAMQGRLIPRLVGCQEVERSLPPLLRAIRRRMSVAAVRSDPVGQVDF